MRILVRVAILLCAVWLVAGVIIFISRSLRPTPDSFRAYLQKNSLAQAGSSQREKILTTAAGQLNRLTFEERKTLYDTGTVRQFVGEMTAEEKSRFLDLTLPEGFRQLMLALNKMDPEKRKKLVDRAIEDISKNDPGTQERFNEDQARKIMEQGLSQFYEEASSDVKLDFAPVIERLQRSTQNLQ